MVGVFIHLPHKHQYGPFSCPDDVDVGTYARRIIHSSPRPGHPSKLAIVDCDIWVQLPKIADDCKHVLLLVSTKDKGINAVHVYVVEMKEDTISADEVRSFVRGVYGPTSIGNDSLCSYRDQQDQILSEKGKVQCQRKPVAYGIGRPLPAMTFYSILRLSKQIVI